MKNKFQNISSVTQEVAMVSFVLSLIIGLILFNDRTLTPMFVFMITLLSVAYGEEILLVFAGEELKLRIHIGDIGLSYLKFAIIIFKCNGKITNDELARIEKYMSSEYNEKIGQASKNFINKNRNKNYSIKKVCRELLDLKRTHKIQLIYQLFALAYADNKLHKKEERIILQISNELLININHFKNIRAMFVKSKKAKTERSNYSSYSRQRTYQKNNIFFTGTSFAYLELGVNPGISDNELKTVYRKLAMKYHPDKWANSDAGEQNKAKEKFQRINNAYNLIKKARNLK